MTSLMRARLLAAAVALAATTALLPAAAEAAPTVTEFSTGITLGGEPYGIATAADGTLWFTENGLIGRLGRITTAGSVTEFAGGLAIGGGPLGIATGPDGNVWFTENLLLGSVGRASPAGSITRFTAGLTLGGQLRHIAAGPDGNLWATWSANPGRIVRITTAGTITQFTGNGLSSNAQPSGIAPGPDGAVWFTEKASPARIGRIAMDGSVTQYALPSAGSAPETITLGPDGNLWFTQANGIGRITPAGVVTEFTTGVTAGSRPTGIVAGRDGALWFTSATDPGRIGRITTAGLVTEYALPTANGAPTGIASGPDGNVWFTERTGGRIGRITIPPGVTPGLAGAIDHTGATVTASVTPNSQATTLAIDWGTTAAYGATTSAVPAGSGAGAGGVAVPLTGLTAATTYHFRTVATNASGTSYGPDGVFTTSAAPVVPPVVAPPAPPDDGGGTIPPAAHPVAGSTVLARPVAGAVLVRLPGSAAPIPLDGASSLPLGAVIDATAGRVTITSDLGGGRTQRAAFWAGAFTLGQAARGGWVDIRLRGPLPACGAPGVRRQAAKARGRSLWSKDNGGKYRTHGRNSVAVVRGTQWFTRERCDGTLTRVQDGAVAVRDLTRGRTVLVRPGRWYVARRGR